MADAILASCAGRDHHTECLPMAWYETSILGHGDDVTLAAVVGKTIVVVRSGSDVWAIEDRCSHAGCAFSDDGEIDGTTVICNCHGAEFDIRSGECLAPPATEPIRTFPARVVGDRVEVFL